MAKSIVIIGAGQAGGTLAQTLGRLPYPAKITLVGSEAHPPYQRPPLSKSALVGEISGEDCYLWSGKQEPTVELRLGTTARRIDRLRRHIGLSKGDDLEYDVLVIATGAKPRKLTIPGRNLDRVFYLRTIEDCVAIRDALRASDGQHPWLIVGAGWIGLETAASLRGLGANVIVVESQSTICARSLPKVLARYLQEIHEQRGVTFLLGQNLVSLEDQHGQLRAELSNGQRLTVAAVIVGIGVVPNSELATDAGLETSDGIKVNEFGQTSDPAIYAIGDVARRPDALLGGLVRLESAAHAESQAVSIAHIIAGGKEPFREVPWFWSDQYDLNIQVLGYPRLGDRDVTRGKPEEQKFTTFYLRDQTVCGAIAVNNGPEIRILRSVINQMPRASKAQLADVTIPLRSILNNADCKND